MPRYTDIHTHLDTEPGRVRAVRNILIKDKEPEKGDATFYSAGIHPWFISDPERQQSLLQEQLQDARVVAVGEAGLDKVCNTDWERQEALFTWQINLSEQLQIPLIVHCVKAYNELIILRKQHPGTQPWIIHGFNGSMEILQQLFEHNCIPSFGQYLLDAQSKATKVFREMGNRPFFLESDEHPGGIEEIYHVATGILGISLEQLKTQQEEHFFTIFKQR